MSPFVAALALLLAPPLARAQNACAPGSFTTATSTFQVDANGNGAWDGDAGGDRTTRIAAYLGPGDPLVADWNGDGADAVGLTTGSSRLYLDLNGNHQWDGAAGGDFAGVRGFMQLVGDWNGDGRDDDGRFLSDVFFVDFYGDRGASTGGGEDFPFATQFRPARRSSATGTATAFLLDLNANGSWDGNGLGDRNAPFAAAPDGPPLAGRWAP